ncbi:MAG: inorganic pyrophosphatase [Salinivirgaceae bacterium]|nr:MAG: inorganic pyrophosphatase [Salinivirgaceae bacterium]
MRNKIMDPIGKLMGLRYKSHPWHGIDPGPDAPHLMTAYIEMVPTDTVKYEADKSSGYLRIDRPQKYSNVIPALYGFFPQSYCGEKVGKYCSKMTERKQIKGDADPLDVCVLTERTISHGDILAHVIPIGGFRMIDGNMADDKIIAVLKNDAGYGHYKNIDDVPSAVLERLKHYFLTYKDIPGNNDRVSEITHTYGAEEAFKVIEFALEDYHHRFDSLESVLDKV